MSCCKDGDPTKVTPLKKSATAKPATGGKSLSMTKEAANFVGELLKNEDKEGWGLKVEVVPGGCAGYKYFMQLQEKPDPADKVFKFFGVKIFLPLMSLGLIKGSSIEYIQTLEATGLKINNPNATSGCACGKSFG